MIRKYIQAAVVAAAAFLFTLPAIAQSPAAQTKLTVVFPPVADIAAFYAAKTQGFFEKRGIEINPVVLAVSSNVPAAIVSKSADIGILTVPTFLQAVEGGLDLKVVAGSSVTTKDYNGSFIARTGSGIKTAQDLVGKRVGVPGLNALLHILFQQWLTDRGVDHRRVTFAEVGFAQMNDALRGGTVDAVLAVDPFIPRILGAGTGYEVAAFVRELPEGTMILVCIADAGWAKANAKTVADFKAAFAEGQTWVEQNRAGALQAVGQFTKMPPEVLANMKLATNRVEASEQGLQYWVDLMNRVGVLKTKPDVRAMVYR